MRHHGAVSHILPSGHFNSHTPHGVRLNALSLSLPSINFNSHTPHGVRLCHIMHHPKKEQFQLTHPTRGATRKLRRNRLIRYISTHTPHTGCDAAGRLKPAQYFNISTHTPHTGCDTLTIVRQCIIVNFNSHTPHGVRLGRCSVNALWVISTHTPHTGCD